MFAFRIKMKLDRERIHRNEIASRLQSERRKHDSYTRQLADYARPRCGMERYGDFSKESKLELEQKLRSCEHEIARDEAALSESAKKCNALLGSLHAPAKDKPSKFAFLTSFL